MKGDATVAVCRVSFGMAMSWQHMRDKFPRGKWKGETKVNVALLGLGIVTQLPGHSGDFKCCCQGYAYECQSGSTPTTAAVAVDVVAVVAVAVAIASTKRTTPI